MGTNAPNLTLLVAAALYFRSTEARDRAGRFGAWTLIAVLAILYMASLVGPPPPNPRALAIVSLGGWLFIAWANWAERHRQAEGF